MIKGDVLKRLIDEIRKLTPRKRLYRVLKQELSALGYWKNKPRGKPGLWFKNYE